MWRVLLKINDILEALMTRSDGPMGLSEWSNEDIVLSGGMRAGGASDPGEVRLKYMIYDLQTIDMKDPQPSGHVDLNVRTNDGMIVGLVDIKIDVKARRNGLGRRVINALSETAGELSVYDIKKSAKKFWDKMGIQYSSRIGRTDGIINHEAE